MMTSVRLCTGFFLKLCTGGKDDQDGYEEAVNWELKLIHDFLRGLFKICRLFKSHLDVDEISMEGMR